MRLNAKIMLALLVAVITGAASCKKYDFTHNVLDAEQLVSGRVAGTWANPSNIVTPDNLPPEVFGAMRLTFTTDATGKPSKFLAQSCPIVFGDAGSGTWTVAGTQDSATIKLVGIDPLDEFSVKIKESTMTLSFYMGWENTDTKVTGKGDFKVTLTRQ